LLPFFQHVVTSASCGIYKSDPGIYSYTLDLFSVSPENAVHIGDSHRFDVVSAASIGMQTILYTSEDGQNLQPQPDAIVDSLGDAASHLDRLLGNRILD
jgi:FMN phosphatase YigB (HAD superfamily)